jgi:hypothetical protein
VLCISVDRPILRRCTGGAHSEPLAQRVHRANPGFVDALDVDVLRHADI